MYVNLICRSFGPVKSALEMLSQSVQQSLQRSPFKPSPQNLMVYNTL